MMLNYTNILLFYLSLNILSSSSEVYNQRNHYITRTPKATTRTLCECELYAPSNYDNDPEMKAVLQGFDRQTSQRFEEYNERLLENKQKCKDQRDKDIQKIILKDKLEKQMAQQLTTLETKIDTNDIPTCICETSVADKTEKFCLKCGYGLGSVTPSVGLFGALAVNQWKTGAMAAAAQKGIKAGIATVVTELEYLAEKFVEIRIDIVGMINAETYRCPQALITSIYAQQQKVCDDIGKNASICYRLGQNNNSIWFRPEVLQATQEGIDAAKNAEKAQIALVNEESAHLYSAIGYSVLAILIIVLVMLIIYLILRYRRKKKMKKKLQYIKLLKE
ncbi:rifin [Plasmodium falciparum IGH-CR14]|uniref:Rifin n=1 Tax=Plasmodium falciparum IGH-CR14 TaxID=580059 RepID=A0A0L1I4T2_PLAFA|nr:rifin [Plasmodium falciparum IGH-CR14]